jgi:uncharacterized protein (TIGR00251 family)
VTIFYQWQDDDLVLNIRVQPRASSDGFAEELGDQIKLRLTSPPVDGKANTHLISFLARTFKVAKSSIRIISGVTGRNKRIKVHQPTRLPDIISRIP